MYTALPPWAATRNISSRKSRTRQVHGKHLLELAVPGITTTPATYKYDEWHRCKEGFAVTMMALTCGQANLKQCRAER